VCQNNPYTLKAKPACDISNPKDNIIDGKDLAIFAGDWLKGK
jgi:hypothetical protein